MGKTEIRNKYIEIRSDLSVADVKERSQKVADTLLATLDWQSLKRMHAYTCVTKWHEVKTSWLADLVATKYPHIELQYSNPDRSSPIPDGTFDVILVPLLAFDTNLNRLGFGGGWYDRFLARQDSALKIGLAYDVQLSDTLPVQPHDIPLDMVITESTIFTK